MDTSALASDIGNIVEAFVQAGGAELSQMKEIWRSTGFTFIHEARPENANPASFMQALYSSTLGHLRSDMPWLRRLGGLYVLYILYETQLFAPPFKIYLSPGDLENIQTIVKVAKAEGPLTAFKVVRRMMARDCFLLGSVTTSREQMKQTIEMVANDAAMHAQAECQRLLRNSFVEQHFKGNLVEDLGLDELATLTKDYAATKQKIYSSGSEAQQVGNETFGLDLGEELMKDANAWMERRQSFFQNNEPLIDFEMELERTLENENDVA